VVKPRKQSAVPKPGGHGSVCSARSPVRLWCATPKPVKVAGPEVMVKVCGVAMTRLPGHSWTPTSTTGRMSERGNRLGLPSWLAIQVASGQVRRRLMTRGRGGGLVVVVGLTTHQGGRESRPQGEGGQQVRSSGVGMPGGRL